MGETVLNLTRELERLISHVTEHVPELSHIDPSRLLICISTTRGSGVRGTYARIHPLRFSGGARTMEQRRGRYRYLRTMPSITHRGEEILYVIYFLVPRFVDLPLREKLITVFHELYHISPNFDGDIRRFPGRNFAHGSSTRKYNAYMGKLVDAYLKEHGKPELLVSLDGTMAQLRERYRVIVGRRFRIPLIKTERHFPAR